VLLLLAWRKAEKDLEMVEVKDLVEMRGKKACEKWGNEGLR